MTGAPAPGHSTQPVIKTCLCAIGRFCISRQLHALIHWSWQLVKVTLGVVFFLWVIGIPGKLLVTYVQPHVAPYQVDVSRITWNPLKGIVIHHIGLYDSNLVSDALARIDTCVVRPSYRDIVRGRWTIHQVSWSGGTAILPQEDKLNELDDIKIPSFHDVAGSVSLSNTHAELSISMTSDLGSLYTIDGRIAYRPTSDDPAPTPGPGWPDYVQKIHQGIYRSPTWLVFMRERFGVINFSAPPTIHIQFDYDPHRAGSPDGTFTYRAPSFTYFGQAFDRMHVDLVRSNGMVNITQAIVQQGEHRLRLTGSYAPSTTNFEAHAYSDLPTSSMMPYLPVAWSKKLAAWGLELSGTMNTEAWIGPCRLADVPRHWGGWLNITDARLNDVPIERAFISFKREDDRFMLEDGQITGGTGVGRGKLHFSHNMDYTKREIAGTCDLSFELKQLSQILPRGLRYTANLFDIETRPVEFSGTYSAPLDDLDQLVVSGHISGTNGAFRGVKLTGVNTYLVYSNNNVKLDPFFVTCPTGKISGSLDLDLKQNLYGIKLDISTNPKTVAPMGGTNLARYFAPYHFTDDMFVRVQGMIDAAKDKKTDLSVTLSGRGFGYKRITVDRASAQATRLPGRLMISNIVGSIYQGFGTGSVDIAFTKTGDTFQADVALTNISLDQLVAELALQATNQYEGIISTSVSLRGNVPDQEGWPNLSGTGTIAIKDGRLLRIPVFGGLSTLLEKIYPGLGFSEQNSLEASLTFRDGAVHTDDLRLSGNVLSLSAKGSYSWLDELDFDVKVLPFRDGSIASVVRIVTLPLSFILELEMTGSFKNPRWRAANLPL